MNSKSTPVCPKCGYKASSAGDPLVTGPFERRECPACGIYLAKYVNLQKNRTANSNGVWDPDQVSHTLPYSTSNTKKRVGKGMVVLAVIILLICAGVQWNSWSPGYFGDPAGFKRVPWIVGANSAEVLIIGPT